MICPGACPVPLVWPIFKCLTSDSGRSKTQMQELLQEVAPIDRVNMCVMRVFHGGK